MSGFRKLAAEVVDLSVSPPVGSVTTEGFRAHAVVHRSVRQSLTRQDKTAAPAPIDVDRGSRFRSVGTTTYASLAQGPPGLAMAQYVVRTGDESPSSHPRDGSATSLPSLLRRCGNHRRRGPD